MQIIISMSSSRDVVGCDGIVSKLRKYQKTAAAGRRKGHDVRDL